MKLRLSSGFPNTKVTHYLGCIIIGEILVAMIVSDSLIGRAEKSLLFNSQDF